MNYTTFNQNQFDATKEPMFFGNYVNVSRYDVQKHPIFEKLIEKQLSFFWRPEEIDVTQDRKDFLSLSEHERHIFLSNLQYQTLLDSVQGRSPNIAFLPVVSLPELETWIETWAFSETIHSRSYTHIIRNILPESSEVFDGIVDTDAILDRATDITKHYDQLIMMTQLFQTQGEGTFTVNGQPTEVTLRTLKRILYLTMVSVNVLEALRFYISFACSFAFAERAKMEGNAKIIKLIARDEALHLTGTQHILNLMASGNDDPEMEVVARECHEEARHIFLDAVEQEKAWADYLFKDGSMIGLNKEILCQYIEYIAAQRMDALQFSHSFSQKQNPLPWMNAWLNSDNVQVAPQEVEVSSYLVGQVDSELKSNEFENFTL